MQKGTWLILLTMLALCAGSGRAKPPAFEYPSALLDLHDADGSCWTGMDAAGGFPAPVVPDRWLVGPPPSPDSAVTLPTDHWIDLAFSGLLADGDGNDIVVVETGKAGEQALLFVTDGRDQEYLLTRIAIGIDSRQDLSYVGIDLDGVTGSANTLDLVRAPRLPFVPRALRLVALDLGGQSPGFDVSHVTALVSHDGGPGACYPNPLDGATGVSPDARLTWSPDPAATGQTIYLGEAAGAVRAGAAEVRHPSLAPDANTFTPSGLRLGRTYYWRVDETRADSNAVRAGEVWSFTVADRRAIDDFETYDLSQHFLYETWQTRGWADVSIEQGIAVSCSQAMSFRYHFDATWSAEVARTFDAPQDWTCHEARVLEFALRGVPGNATNGQLYIVLGDGQTQQRVLYPGDLQILAEPRWHACRIALADFNSVDLTHVTSLALGLRCAATDPQRGTGTVYIDDMVLRPTVCLGTQDSALGPASAGPPGDLTGDCLVDYRDLQRLAQRWLYDRTRPLIMAAPNEPILSYDFDGNAQDRAGTSNGQIVGRCNFVPGVTGQAIRFLSEGDGVIVTNAPGVFGRVRDAITIAFWQRGDDSTHLNDTLCCSNYVYGRSDPAVAIQLGCWRSPGQYRWDCGYPFSFDNRLAGRHQSKEEWAGRWNHWAFTKDARTGRMEIYLNGALYDSRSGASAPITGVTSFEIGAGWYGRYDGALDDFRIYDYALSAAEVAHVATGGTGILPEPPNAPADLNSDGTVNFGDFALLATHWLETNLWP